MKSIEGDESPRIIDPNHASRRQPSLLALAALSALFPFVIHAEAASNPSTNDTIPRKVLVLDFVNQAKDAKSDYLSVSVAEALLDPLKKTGKFYLLPRASTALGDRGSETNAPGRSLSAVETRDLAPTFDETTAITRGKAAGADVVVIGNFVSVENKVQIQTKAIDVLTGQIAVAKTTAGKLDASVFDLIQNLADDMSAAMASALPPLPVIYIMLGVGYRI